MWVQYRYSFRPKYVDTCSVLLRTFGCLPFLGSWINHECLWGEKVKRCYQTFFCACVVLPIQGSMTSWPREFWPWLTSQSLVSSIDSISSFLTMSVRFQVCANVNWWITLSLFAEIEIEIDIKWYRLNHNYHAKTIAIKISGLNLQTVLSSNSQANYIKKRYKSVIYCE